MGDDRVRIDRLVIRAPAAAIGPGQGDEPARRYARAVADALSHALRGNDRRTELSQLQLRVHDVASPAEVARRIAESIPRGPT